ncbi:MAG: hypothetical protein KGM24_02655 [Elusimicrobia bacterium]|nr:hypothetical protein [Elusimicrobiota bacterium]
MLAPLAAVLALLAAPPARAAYVTDVGREHPAARAGSAATNSDSGFVSAEAFAPERGTGASSRPDGTGRASYGLHAYVLNAYVDDRLQFLADLLGLGDKSSGAWKPETFDYLLGAATRPGSGKYKLQVDRDEALTLRGSYVERQYWDARFALLFGAQDADPARRGAAAGASWSATASLGWLWDNPNTPARLDGTGRGLLRYEGMLEGDLSAFLVRGDAVFLTDRNGPHWRPADMDVSAGIGARANGGELMILWRVRDTFDRVGFASYYELSLSVPFDVGGSAPPVQTGGIF